MRLPEPEFCWIQEQGEIMGEEKRGKGRKQGQGLGGKEGENEGKRLGGKGPESTLEKL